MREINRNAIPSREADGGSTGKVWKSTRITENVVLKVSQASVYLEKCGKSGIGKNDCVYIGADSLGSNGYTKSVQSQPKVFRNDTFKDVVMGSTSTFRHIDLLKYSETLFPELDYYKKTEIDRQKDELNKNTEYESKKDLSYAEDKFQI